MDPLPDENTPDSSHPLGVTPKVTWGHLMFIAIFVCGWLTHGLTTGAQPSPQTTIGYLFFAALVGALWDFLIGRHYAGNLISGRTDRASGDELM